MGPSNVALLKLYRADQALREAGAKLNAVTRDVRAQEARNTQLKARLEAAQTRLKELQSRNANNELELKVRGEHIDKLRDRQSSAVNNKEYQALLVEINTAKVDRAVEAQVDVPLRGAARAIAADASWSIVEHRVPVVVETRRDRVWRGR